MQSPWPDCILCMVNLKMNDSRIAISHILRMTPQVEFDVFALGITQVEILDCDAINIQPLGPIIPKDEKQITARWFIGRSA